MLCMNVNVYDDIMFNLDDINNDVELLFFV